MRKLIVILLLVCIVPVQAAAAQWDEEPLDRLREAIPESSADISESYTPDGFLDGVQDIFLDTLSQSKTVLRAALLSMLRIFGILILCQLMKQFGKTDHAASLVCALGITAAASTDVKALLGMGMRVMDEIHTFSDTLLPILSSAAAASGSVTGAGISYTVAVVFGDILINLCRTVLTPMIYAFVALAAADAAMGESRMKKLRELIGWLISGGLKLLLSAFTAFLTVTGILCGASDAMAVKTAKLTLSSMIPVVGSILSDASETLLAGAGMVRTAAGTLGMTAILAAFALPCLKIAVSYGSFRITGALGGIFDSGQSALLDSISTAMGFVLAMVSSCAFMGLMSCCCLMKAVQPG